MDSDGAGKVSWEEFERWWTSRSGDPAPSCPVSTDVLYTLRNFWSNPQSCFPGNAVLSQALTHTCLCCAGVARGDGGKDLGYGASPQGLVENVSRVGACRWSVEITGTMAHAYRQAPQHERGWAFLRPRLKLLVTLQVSTARVPVQIQVALSLVVRMCL